MKALITGGTGFAGAHLADHCRDCGDDVEAAGSAQVDLLDGDGTRDAT